jgi:hypothetical protein
MTTLIDVKKGSRGAYHLEVHDESCGIKKWGDFDPEVVKQYLGKDAANQTGRVVELVDRLPEDSVIHIGPTATEVFKQDKSVIVFPTGLDLFDVTTAALDLLIEEKSEVGGPIDLRGSDE